MAGKDTQCVFSLLLLVPVSSVEFFFLFSYLQNWGVKYQTVFSIVAIVLNLFFINYSEHFFYRVDFLVEEGANEWSFGD